MITLRLWQPSSPHLSSEGGPEHRVHWARAPNSPPCVTRPFTTTVCPRLSVTKRGPDSQDPSPGRPVLTTPVEIHSHSLNLLQSPCPHEALTALDVFALVPAVLPGGRKGQGGGMRCLLFSDMQWVLNKDLLNQRMVIPYLSFYLLFFKYIY